MHLYSSEYILCISSCLQSFWCKWHTMCCSIYLSTDMLFKSRGIYISILLFLLLCKNAHNIADMKRLSVAHKKRSTAEYLIIHQHRINNLALGLCLAPTDCLSSEIVNVFTHDIFEMFLSHLFSEKNEQKMSLNCLR